MNETHAAILIIVMVCCIVWVEFEDNGRNEKGHK